VEGIKAVGQDALVRAALRQRPDALAVGEVRGAEIKDMLKAMWTGHRNGLTSIHADSIQEVPERMRMMLQEANFSTEISEETVGLWIAKSFHLAIMYRQGVEIMRQVEDISEFTGVVEGRMPAMNKIFVNKGNGLELAGGKLYHEEMWKKYGYEFEWIRSYADS
jgi:pilus assembly protein CpaF